MIGRLTLPLRTQFNPDASYQFYQKNRGELFNRSDQTKQHLERKLLLELAKDDPDLMISFCEAELEKDDQWEMGDGDVVKLVLSEAMTTKLRKGEDISSLVKLAQRIVNEESVNGSLTSKRKMVNRIDAILPIVVLSSQRQDGTLQKLLKDIGKRYDQMGLRFSEMYLNDLSHLFIEADRRDLFEVYDHAEDVQPGLGYKFMLHLWDKSIDEQYASYRNLMTTAGWFRFQGHNNDFIWQVIKGQAQKSDSSYLQFVNFDQQKEMFRIIVDDGQSDFAAQILNQTIRHRNGPHSVEEELNYLRKKFPKQFLDIFENNNDLFQGDNFVNKWHLSYGKIEAQARLAYQGNIESYFDVIKGKIQEATTSEELHVAGDLFSILIEDGTPQDRIKWINFLREEVIPITASIEYPVDLTDSWNYLLTKIFEKIPGTERLDLLKEIFRETDAEAQNDRHLHISSLINLSSLSEDLTADQLFELIPIASDAFNRINRAMGIIGPEDYIFYGPVSSMLASLISEDPERGLSLVSEISSKTNRENGYTAERLRVLALMCSGEGLVSKVTKDKLQEIRLKCDFPVSTENDLYLALRLAYKGEDGIEQDIETINNLRRNAEKRGEDFDSFWTHHVEGLLRFQVTYGNRARRLLNEVNGGLDEISSTVNSLTLLNREQYEEVMYQRFIVPLVIENSAVEEQDKQQLDEFLEIHQEDYELSSVVSQLIERYGNGNPAVDISLLAIANNYRLLSGKAVDTYIENYGEEWQTKIESLKQELYTNWQSWKGFGVPQDEFWTEFKKVVPVIVDAGFSDFLSNQFDMHRFFSLAANENSARILFDKSMTVSQLSEAREKMGIQIDRLGYVTVNALSQALDVINYGDPGRIDARAKFLKQMLAEKTPHFVNIVNSLARNEGLLDVGSKKDRRIIREAIDYLGVITPNVLRMYVEAENPSDRLAFVEQFRAGQQDMWVNTPIKEITERGIVADLVSAAYPGINYQGVEEAFDRIDDACADLTHIQFPRDGYVCVSPQVESVVQVKEGVEIDRSLFDKLMTIVEGGKEPTVQTESLSNLLREIIDTRGAVTEAEITNEMFSGLMELFAEEPTIQRLRQSRPNFDEPTEIVNYLAQSNEAFGIFFHDNLPESLEKWLSKNNSVFSSLSGKESAIYRQIVSVIGDQELSAVAERASAEFFESNRWNEKKLAELLSVVIEDRILTRSKTGLRKRLEKEIEKFDFRTAEGKRLGKTIRLKARVTKNFGSAFSPEAAGICTQGDWTLFRRPSLSYNIH